MSVLDWRDRLAALPEPMTGDNPWHTPGLEGEDAYQRAAELTAKAMLIVVDENPDLLNIPTSIVDPWERANYDAAWQAAKDRWPGLNDWLGGITGNMFGWANQLVRHIHDVEQVGNPAIVTVRLPGGE